MKYDKFIDYISNKKTIMLKNNYDKITRPRQFIAVD